MSNVEAKSKGMARILDGIMTYRETLRPTLLEEFKRVALGPSVSPILISSEDFCLSLSLKVFY